MDELAPGIRIIENIGLSEEDLLKQELAMQAAEAADLKEHRKLSTLTEVGLSLSKGHHVKITDEMRELGIAERVSYMIQEAQYYYNLNKFFMDSDDYDD